jgi:hypothetical protein
MSHFEEVKEHYFRQSALVHIAAVCQTFSNVDRELEFKEENLHLVTKILRRSKWALDWLIEI